jgi:hypothetical protein
MIMKNDPYFLHRLALKPLLSPTPQEEFKTIAAQIQEIGEDSFLDFLSYNMLIPLWFETLSKYDAASFFSENFTDNLKKIAMLITARYMGQQHTIHKAAEAFQSADISYAVFKGANIREQIYDNPAVRPSDDIDILVSKTDKTRAIQALVKAGFAFQPEPENISHEAGLIGPNGSIDLHWDILRPGRTRIDLTDELLATREEYSNYWGFGAEAELFIMLVHPVFTKYTTAPQASIIRLVDLARWIDKHDIDWEKVYNWLEKGGVKTPAWLTKQWLEMITGKTLPESFVQKIEPSGLKKSYLQNWLNKNYSTKFLNKPFLVKAGFTLPVHDTFSDAIRAVRTLQREKKTAQAETEKLITSLE